MLSPRITPGLKFLAAAILIATCGQGVAQNSGNLLTNGSFEGPAIDNRDSLPILPSGWTLFTSDTSPVDVTVINDVPFAGKQACRITGSKRVDGFHGLTQTVAVTGDASYMVTAQVRNDPEHPLEGSLQGQLSIEWLNGDQEIQRDYSGDWRSTLSIRHWTEIQMPVNAPAGATHARIIIIMREGATPERGSFLIDVINMIIEP